LVAGRALRPLRVITATTQRISDQNLHQRLAVAGPDDELKHLGDTIDELLARLENAFEAQRRFVSNASHELRTPLTMMRTAVDVATRKTDPPPPAVMMLADKVRVGLDKAERLVDSFLALARAQHGSLDRSTVALDALTRAAVTEHADAIQGRHLTMEHDCGPASVVGSETLLTDLLDNLIDNAIRHNQPGGWIRVETAADNATGRALLTVENSGVVLDPAIVGELLRPFSHAEPDRVGTDRRGVGLGLSIISAIIASHDGDLELSARPAGGLRITITLPASMRATTALESATSAGVTR
jgi:hypothetical protein